MAETLTRPAYAGSWPQPDLEMTTSNRMVILSMEEIAMLQGCIAVTRQHHPYNPAVIDRPALQDLIAKLEAQPTHKHIERGTQLRLIGHAKVKNSDQVFALYETPCRIVYAAPLAHWQDRFVAI